MSATASLRPESQRGATYTSVIAQTASRANREIDAADSVGNADTAAFIAERTNIALDEWPLCTWDLPLMRHAVERPRWVADSTGRATHSQRPNFRNAGEFVDIDHEMRIPKI
ncbi:hypothetical protein FAZ69_04785 [Trinickia terrae]|uniref:Uncharacterized protein n=1 Tax=Trinickia terrae TaxID=2571161 RepID=A0A4V5PJK3_9BURK|nr:hypothetical protein [Trinickia terrae]TKC91760.1 hypothetical protein FAZ69_04785 [Trinickia terrae]